MFEPISILICYFWSDIITSFTFSILSSLNLCIIELIVPFRSWDWCFSLWTKDKKCFSLFFKILQTFLSFLLILLLFLSFLFNPLLMFLLLNPHKFHLIVFPSILLWKWHHCLRLQFFQFRGQFSLFNKRNIFLSYFSFNLLNLILPLLLNLFLCSMSNVLILKQTWRININVSQNLSLLLRFCQFFLNDIIRQIQPNQLSSLRIWLSMLSSLQVSVLLLFLLLLFSFLFFLLLFLFSKISMFCIRFYFSFILFSNFSLEFFNRLLFFFLFSFQLFLFFPQFLFIFKSSLLWLFLTINVVFSLFGRYLGLLESLFEFSLFSLFGFSNLFFWKSCFCFDLVSLLGCFKFFFTQCDSFLLLLLESLDCFFIILWSFIRLDRLR